VRKTNRGGDYDQSVIHVYMDIPQGNPFVQLIYTNKISKRVDCIFQGT
jgi:hypothetical protein